MTDLIERVDAVFTDDAAGETPRTDGAASQSAVSRSESTEKSVPILLAVSLAASGVLLLAVASGHLRGTVAGFGVVAALANVAAAVLVITRPSRGLFVGVSWLSVATGVEWVAGYRPHGLASATVVIGIALAAASQARVVAWRKAPPPRRSRWRGGSANPARWSTRTTSSQYPDAPRGRRQ